MQDIEESSKCRTNACCAKWSAQFSDSKASNPSSSGGASSGGVSSGGGSSGGGGDGKRKKRQVDIVTSKSAPGELPFRWEDVHYESQDYIHSDFDASMEQEPPAADAQLHDHARHDPRASRRPFALHEKNFDILIVGGGVIGCAIARHLSQYKLNIALLEKASDVSQGASKANSGIVHGGFDEQHGTVKSQLSSKGNRMFPQLEKELNFGFKETGSLVLAFEPSHTVILQRLLKNGNLNGVNNLKIIDREEVLKIEPNVNPDVYQALWCPTAGITSPYEFCIALAENAVKNGVTVLLEHEVMDISRHSESVSEYEGGEAFVEDDPEDLLTNIYKDECGWTPPIATGDKSHGSREAQYFVVRARTMNASLEDHEGGEEVFRSRIVINCAGLYSDKVADMVGARDFDIMPRKGEYIILDKTQGHLCKTVLFPVPDPKLGKGILVSPTFHGNLLLGPTSRDLKVCILLLTTNSKIGQGTKSDQQ
jgi:glycine/D-amino acid oxidase-like deaminating enzyme